MNKHQPVLQRSTLIFYQTYKDPSFQPTQAFSSKQYITKFTTIATTRIAHAWLTVHRKWQTAPVRKYNFGMVSIPLASNQGWQVWLQSGSDWTPNQTNPGLFQISFSTFGLNEPKCTETDLKKSQICPNLRSI